MASRKDPEIKQNIDRGHEEDQASAGIDSRNNNYNNDSGTNPETVIKNANAAGIGSMGRNDQQQTGYTSNHPADAAND